MCKLKKKSPKTADISEIGTDSHVRNPQYGKRPETQLVLEFHFLASNLGMDCDQSKMVPRTSQWSEVKRSLCLEPFSRLINPSSYRISQCRWVPESLFYNVHCSIWFLQFSYLKQLVFQIPAKAALLPFNVPPCCILSFAQILWCPGRERGLQLPETHAKIYYLVSQTFRHCIMRARSSPLFQSS